MLYTPAPSESEMKAFGITADLYDVEELSLDSDDYPAYEIFAQLGTQWRIAGMNGQPMGLEYSAIPMMMDIYETADRKHILSCIQIMERQAIDVMAETRKQATQ